jgi:hypothetical protein
LAAENLNPDLPPTPDPETGEPKPPAAPTQHAEGYNERKPSRVPTPPPGHGPIPAAIVLIAGIWRSGFDALTDWVLWVFVIPVYAWSVYVGRANVVSAGTDWVMCRKYWVRTYELTSIRLVSRGVNGAALRLADSERSVDMPLSLVQSNRELWNYVYLGMRYSAANGAEVNRAARNTYPELPSP